MKKYVLFDFIVLVLLGVALVVDIYYDFPKYYRVCILSLLFVAAVVRVFAYLKFFLKNKHQ